MKCKNCLYNCNGKIMSCKVKKLIKKINKPKKTTLNTGFKVKDVLECYVKITPFKRKLEENEKEQIRKEFQMTAEQIIDTYQYL